MGLKQNSLLTDSSVGVHQRNFTDSSSEGVHVVIIFHSDAVDGFVTETVKKRMSKDVQSVVLKIKYLVALMFHYLVKSG